MIFVTASFPKLSVLFCFMMCLVITPAILAQQVTHITVHGDTHYRLHGTDTIVPTHFGFNHGSGGTRETDRLQANWFRSTSPTRLTRNVEQDSSTPDTVDINWLQKTYNLATPQPEKYRSKHGKILLFHPHSKDGKVNWLNPLTGEETRDEKAAKQWARIAAQVVAYHSRPFADGTRPRLMFEFGNELMFQHYLHTPLLDRDINRCGPGMNGHQATLAMARWVHESARAIRTLTPDAKILAGSGDMTLSTRDFWGWQYWDKPFLDQCTPLIDGYATHWYAQSPQLMLTEAALIRAYTQSRFNKPLSTHVTEYGHPKTGEEQSMDRQWFRVRFHGDVLFMAMRDPDKIAGLYSFIWSDPRFMPYFQVKGTPLEKWFELFSDLQGQRVYVQSDDPQQLHMQASVHGNKLNVVIQNNQQQTQRIAMKLKAPAAKQFAAWQWRTLAYAHQTQQMMNTGKQGSFSNTQTQWQMPEMVLEAGQTVSVTMDFVDTDDTSENKQVTTTSFASCDVMVDAGKPMEITIPGDALLNKQYATLRMGISTLDSHWSDTLVKVNDSWYRVDFPLDRKPVRWVQIPVQVSDLKSVNRVILHPFAGEQLCVMVAELEVSDVPMLSQQAQVVSHMVQLQLPNTSIIAGQTVMLAPMLLDRKATLQELHWDLPTGWEIQSASNGYALQVPKDCKGDWYPIRLHGRTHDGQTVMAQSQVRVLAPVSCPRFSSRSQTMASADVTAEVAGMPGTRVHGSRVWVFAGAKTAGITMPGVASCANGLMPAPSGGVLSRQQ